MRTGKSSSGGVSATSLGTFGIFSSLSLEERTQVASLMGTKDYPAGAYIISATQRQADVYFLISGSVKACAFSENGKQIYFDQLSAGMMFGELAAIDEGERSSDCIALKATKLATLSRDNFMEVMHRYRAVQDAVLKRLTDMLRNQMQRVYELNAFNVKQRIRFELLRMASNADSVETPIAFAQAPTHADIAARIGTHREAVTRELKKLERDGVITWRRGRHVIHDASALAELAIS